MTRKPALYILGAALVAAIGGGAWLRDRPSDAVAVTPVSAVSLPDAMPILECALHACYGVNHVGEQVTTVVAGKQQFTSRVELAYRRPGLTRLRYLDGSLAGAQVWEDRNRIYRYLPKKNRLEITPAEPSKPDRLEQRLKRLRQNYTASLEGTDRVAGRKANRIVVRPRYPGNPWKRIWIDQESYLKLGSEDYDSQDHLLRSTRFVKLSLDSPPEEEFHPSPALLKRATWNRSGDEVPLSPTQVSRQVGFPVLLPAYVPPGYQLLGSFVVPCQCPRGEDTVRSQYRDGLNTISVFQCGHPCENEGNCLVSNAPQGSAVRLTRGQDTFLVVGEIQSAELEKMSRSIPARAQTVSSRPRE